MIPPIGTRCTLFGSALTLKNSSPPLEKSTLPLQIVCVGRLVPAKGQHILLRAFSLLRAKGHALQLTFVGDGPDRASLEREVAELALADTLSFAARSIMIRPANN